MTINITRDGKREVLITFPHQHLQYGRMGKCPGQLEKEINERKGGIFEGTYQMAPLRLAIPDPLRHDRSTE